MVSPVERLYPGPAGMLCASLDPLEDGVLRSPRPEVADRGADDAPRRLVPEEIDPAFVARVQYALAAEGATCQVLEDE